MAILVKYMRCYVVKYSSLVSVILLVMLSFSGISTVLDLLMHVPYDGKPVTHSKNTTNLRHGDGQYAEIRDMVDFHVKQISCDGLVDGNIHTIEEANALHARIER